MSRRDRQASADALRGSPENVDELYGLEPVFEPGRGSEGLIEPTFAHEVECPWCGERISVLIDVSAGSQSYIEDCQVCCQPIEMHLAVDGEGGLAGLEARR